MVKSVSFYMLFAVVELFIHRRLHRNKKNNKLKTFYKRTVSAYIAHESERLTVLNTNIWEADTKPGKYYAMTNINIKKKFPLKHVVANDLKYYLLFKCCCPLHPYILKPKIFTGG